MDDRRTFRFPDDDRTAPKPQPPVFQVWLNRDHPPERFAQAAGEEPYPDFPEGYWHFANVKADSLRDVVAITGADRPLPFDQDEYRRWERRSGVQTFLPGGIERTTEPGDVIVTPSGKTYRYEGETFTEIARSDRLAAGPVPSVADILADPTRHLAPEQAYGQGHDHGPGKGRTR